MEHVALELPLIRSYVFAGLRAMPDVLERLLNGIADDAAVWDRRPDTDRFTLREIAAHLADWDAIFAERIRRTRDEDNPELPAYEPDDLAREHDYAHRSPVDSLHCLRTSRGNFLSMLEALPPGAWARTARREDRVGPFTIEAQVLLVLGHDGYHLQQVAQWLEREAQ